MGRENITAKLMGGGRPNLSYFPAEAFYVMRGSCLERKSDVGGALRIRMVLNISLAKKGDWEL